jgi:hypothetical protein
MDNPVQMTDAPDTIPPPPPAMPRLRKAGARTKSYPVTVRCESEEQRAMLVDWLAETGFDLAP